MPENEETEQVETEPQGTETAPEAETGDGEPFDADRARKALSKKNAENKGLRDRLKELEPLAAKARELEDAQKSEAQRLTDQLAAQQEKAAKAVRAAVASKVEALAAKTFADPEDAAGALDLSGYVDDEGAIDTDAIRRDLEDLLKRKPHWALADDSSPRAPRPDRTQGSSGNGNRTPQKPEEEFAGWLQRALNGGR
ncbi:hypothetical protein [Streptomyces acidiscabies]|uniref:hypothetical protein n=1 Tax=Streptomyces acidiscabies TaxID=42234 RepID=UPI0009516C96|nr:hypothetical protein [Streptomyces acidiscabies]